MSSAARPSVQDMPPPGGFPQTIRYQRYLPRRGPSGVVLFLASFGIMGYGWYWLAIQQAERRELRREKVWNRIHLIPLLQAETDRDHVRRLEAAKKREAEVMKNVPGWSALDLKAPVQGIGRDGRRHEDEATPVYFTDRYIAPNFLFIPPEHGVRIPAQWWRGTKHFFTNPRYHNREDFTEEHPIGIAYD